MPHRKPIDFGAYSKEPNYQELVLGLIIVLPHPSPTIFINQTRSPLGFKGNLRRRSQMTYRHLIHFSITQYQHYELKYNSGPRLKKEASKDFTSSTFAK